jgi:hypothetical protein
MSRSAADVERDVESTRHQLDRTVEALKSKMNPSEVIDEAKGALGEAGQKLLARIMEQARENPLPLALTGVGLVWMLSSTMKSSADGRVSPEARSFAPRTGDSGGLAAKAGHVLSDAKEGVGEFADKAIDAGHAALEGVSGAAAEATDKAQAYGRRLQDSVASMVDREPLLIAALGLFVGLAVGAALPATEFEKDLVEPLNDKIAQKAEDGLARAGDAARAAYDAAKSELVQGDGGDPARGGASANA